MSENPRTVATQQNTPICRALVTAIPVALALLPSVAHAQAIIKQPGNHPDYSVEIEPHFVFQWANRFGDDDGFGPGARFNIPFFQNGPIKTINNNMAISFGLDVTFGDNDCEWWFRRFDRDDWPIADCDATEF